MRQLSARERRSWDGGDEENDPEKAKTDPAVVTVGAKPFRRQVTGSQVAGEGHRFKEKFISLFRVHYELLSPNSNKCSSDASFYTAL